MGDVAKGSTPAKWVGRIIWILVEPKIVNQSAN